MTIKTKTGINVTIKKVRLDYSPSIKLHASFSHPEAGSRDTEISDSITGLKGHRGVYTLALHKGQTIFLTFDGDDLQQLENFLKEVAEETAEQEAHWIEINLGVCFHSDYSCHW
jgi:hypothetical protein